MKRKKCNVILKSSIALVAAMLLESSGLAGNALQLALASEAEETTDTEGSMYGTFDIDSSQGSVKSGAIIGEENSTAERSDSVGEKFSKLGQGNGLSGLPGKIPSADEQSTPAAEGTPAQTDIAASKSGYEYKATEITDPATGLKVARGYAPSDYLVDGETIWCGTWQSVGAPAQVYLTAMSPDGNTVMGYYSLVCYEHILEYSQNGYSLKEQQDGAFDSESMTPMLSFMTADAYCDYLARIILPGQQLEFCSQEETTQETQKLLDEKANELYQQTVQLSQGTGFETQGTYADVVQRNYNVTLNGYPFKLVITTAIEATQMGFDVEAAYMGSVKNSFIAWDSPCTYFMVTPESEYDANKDIFEQFSMNTTVSDQFTNALATVRNQITQGSIQSMSDITSTCQSSMSSSMGTEDTYTSTDQFSDYIFEQNDYTLSNGDHVKVPTSYDYVYEGTDGNVYVSDSSFDQPGGSTQLYPN